MLFAFIPMANASSKDEACPVTVYADLSTEKHVTGRFGPLENSADGRAYMRMKEFFEQRNLCFSMQYTSWQRVLRSAEIDPNGLIFLILRTDEREDKFHWIKELTDDSDPVYLFSYNPLGQNADTTNANNKAICPINGAQCEMLLKNGFSPNDIMEIPRDAGENILEMVFRGRGRYFIDHQTMVDKFLKDKSIPEGSLTRIKEIPLQSAFLAASKNVSPELLEKLR